MALSKQTYQTYIAILQEELIPALGCTEPIAIAYASAKARELLGMFPERIIAECSGKYCQKRKRRCCPTTRTLRGISAAAVIGAVGGDASKKLEILTGVTGRASANGKRTAGDRNLRRKAACNSAKLHIIVRMYSGAHSSMVEIIHTHTGIVRMERTARRFSASRLIRKNRKRD
jgi:L-cysteine desulfidase